MGELGGVRRGMGWVNWEGSGGAWDECIGRGQEGHGMGELGGVRRGMGWVNWEGSGGAWDG